MAIGAGHAAAAGGLYLQRQPEVAEHLHPLAVAVGLVGLLGTVGQQTIGLREADVLAGITVRAGGIGGCRGGGGQNLRQLPCRRSFCQRLQQPFLRQQHPGQVLDAVDLGVLLPEHQRHGRVQPHQRDVEPGQCLQGADVATCHALEGGQEALHLQRLAVGVQRCQPDAQAQSCSQFDEIRQLFGLEIPGETVLHQNDAARTLLGRECSQCGRRGSAHLPSLQHGLECHAVDERAVHHAYMLFHHALNPAVAHDAVVEPRHVGKPRHGEFQRADEVMAQRAQVALVVELQEASAEIRHVHLDGTLPGAGLAGQAAGHGLVHLVREVWHLLPCSAGIAPALPEAAQESRWIARQLQHVHPGVALQAQPFAHQGCSPLGRVLALAGGLP